MTRLVAFEKTVTITDIDELPSIVAEHESDVNCISIQRAIGNGYTVTNWGLVDYHNSEVRLDDDISQYMSVDDFIAEIDAVDAEIDAVDAEIDAAAEIDAVDAEIDAVDAEIDETHGKQTDRVYRKKATELLNAIGHNAMVVNRMNDQGDKYVDTQIKEDLFAVDDRRADIVIVDTETVETASTAAEMALIARANEELTVDKVALVFTAILQVKRNAQRLFDFAFGIRTREYICMQPVGEVARINKLIFDEIAALFNEIA